MPGKHKSKQTNKQTKLDNYNKSTIKQIREIMDMPGRRKQSYWKYHHTSRHRVIMCKQNYYTPIIMQVHGASITLQACIYVCVCICTQ